MKKLAVKKLAVKKKLAVFIEYNFLLYLK